MPDPILNIARQAADFCPSANLPQRSILAALDAAPSQRGDGKSWLAYVIGAVKPDAAPSVMAAQSDRAGAGHTAKARNLGFCELFAAQDKPTNQAVAHIRT